MAKLRKIILHIDIEPSNAHFILHNNFKNNFLLLLYNDANTH